MLAKRVVHDPLGRGRAGYSVAGLLAANAAKDHLSIEQRFTKERARSSTGYW